MSKATPSLMALLGLVAVAGYQNRGRISEMLSDAQKQSPDSGHQTQETLHSGGFLSEIGDFFGGGSTGSTLSTGLSDLVNRFRQSGREAPADSWVSARDNMPVDDRELEAAIGDETLQELQQKTGLSHAELLRRLNAALPEVVNRFTPEGRLPTEAEARNFD